MLLISLCKTKVPQARANYSKAGIPHVQTCSHVEFPLRVTNAGVGFTVLHLVLSITDLCLTPSLMQAAPKRHRTNHSLAMSTVARCTKETTMS